jgi:hypothetical protein
VQSKMEIYRSKAKEFARLAAAAKSARDGRRDRKLADMYWALSLGEEPAAPRLSKRSSEPATPSAIPTRRLVQTAGVEFVSSARRSMSEKGRNISIFLCTKLSNQKKVTLKDLRARSHRSLATLLFLPWPYARYHGFCTHQAPAPRAVIMHWS